MILLLAALAFALPPPEVPSDPSIPVEAPPAPPAEIQLAWSAPAGKTIEIAQDVVTSVGTPNGLQKTSLTTVTSQAVQAGGVAGKGAISWTERVVRQTVEIDTAGEKVKWDSDSAEEPPAGFNALAEMKGATWQISVAPDRKVTATPEPGAGADPVAKAVEAGVSEEAVKSRFDAAAVAKEVERQLDLFPAVALAVGASHKQTLQVPVAGLGEIGIERTLTLNFLDGNKATFQETFAGQPLTKEGVSVSAIAGEGTMSWDVAAGLPTERAVKLRFEVRVDQEGGEPLALPVEIARTTRIVVK